MSKNKPIDVSGLLTFIQSRGAPPLPASKPKQVVAQPSGKGGDSRGGIANAAVTGRAIAAGGVKDAASLISRAEELIAEMKSGGKPPENVVLGVANDLVRTPTLKAAYTNGLLICAALGKNILNPANASARVTLNNALENLVRPCEAINSANSELINQMNDLAYEIASEVVKKNFPLPNENNLDYMIHHLRDIPGQLHHAVLLLSQAFSNSDLYPVTFKTCEVTIIMIERNNLDLEQDPNLPAVIVTILKNTIETFQECKRGAVNQSAQNLREKGYPAHAAEIAIYAFDNYGIEMNYATLTTTRAALFELRKSPKRASEESYDLDKLIQEMHRLIDSHPRNPKPTSNPPQV